MNAEIKSLAFSIFNFIAFFSILFLILKKPVRSFLKKRKSDYVAESEKSAIMKKEALDLMEEIRLKMNSIDKDSQTLLFNTKKEAEQNALNILSKAEKITFSIKNEYDRLAKAEFLATVGKLKKDFVTTLINGAEKNMSSLAGNTEMKKYLEECSSKLNTRGTQK